jgi:hypothetical protein
MTRKNAGATSGQVSLPAPRVRRKKSLPAKKMTQLEFALHFAVVNYGNNYELGKLAGVSADVLSRFSRKERNIRLDTAGRLAKVLGLTLTGEA